MFRFANAAKVVARQQRRFAHDAGHAHVHQPFGLHIKGKIPEGTGAQDMATKLWAMNPGLVVLFSSMATFAVGAGVHVVTRSTTVNSSVGVVLKDA